MRPWIAGIALIAVGCTAEERVTPCEQVCGELVQECGYAAYPDFASCLEGCAYNEERGADIEAEGACIADAQCNTFEIVECENAYGAQDDQ